MTQHWPIPVAAGLIAAAAILGLWQHESAGRAAIPHGPRAQPSAALPAAVSAAAPDAAPVNSAPVAPPVPSARIAPAAPVAPVAPVAAVPPDQVPRLWDDLKNALQNKTRVLPVNKGDGSSNYSMDGAVVDMHPPPDWSITVYNVNPKQPEEETGNFVKSAAAIAEVLGIGGNQSVSGGGESKRTYMKTITRLGMAVIIRDPNGANTWTVHPANKHKPAKAAEPGEKAALAVKNAAPASAAKPAATGKVLPPKPALSAPKHQPASNEPEAAPGEEKF